MKDDLEEIIKSCLFSFVLHFISSGINFDSY